MVGVAVGVVVVVAVVVVVGVGVGVVVVVVVAVVVVVGVGVGVGVVVVVGSLNTKGGPMKRVVETDDGGFDALLGEKIAVFCGVYIYTGKLVGVNADHIELADPLLVYETGELASGTWKNAQVLPSPWRVMRHFIESWGRAKC